MGVAQGAGQAAYMVYVIHLPIMMTAVIAMVEILKAAGLDLQIIPMGEPIVAFFPLDASGNLALLPDGLLWAGFSFTLVVTNIVVWPLSFYMRRLPVLNKMLTWTRRRWWPTGPTSPASSIIVGPSIIVDVGVCDLSRIVGMSYAMAALLLLKIFVKLLV